MKELKMFMFEGCPHCKRADEMIAALLAARPQLLETLHALGFTYLTLDLDGFRSGSMDGGGRA